MNQFRVELILPPIIGSSGRKYKLRMVEDWSFSTGITPLLAIELPYLSMNKAGILTLKKGYAWDGSSGAADTLNSIEASADHDGLYQMIRTGYLPLSARKKADQIYRDVCMKNGMNSLRARIRYRAVRSFGKRTLRKGEGK